MAAVDTTVGASSAESFTAFEGTMDDWSDELIRWRCKLSAAERQRYKAPPGWNCRDVKIFVGRVNYEALGPLLAAELNKVPTRFKLPQKEVDMVIDAGRDALKANLAFKRFLRSLESPAARVAAPKPAPVAPRLAESNE
jgi:NTE family protein